ncbi:hypothetical protein BME18_06080 [Klebsiella michiganensis]|nr:hypothetical protein BME18_06080 [Klebsiella michiganensis]
MSVILSYSRKVIYPSYFKLQVCWLRSFTRITYQSKLIGIHSFAAFLQLELFRYESFAQLKQWARSAFF